MAQRTRAELNSDADTFLPDNNNNEIDALDVRQRVKDLADSSLNVQDNLTDLTDAPAARSALGLGSAATRAVGAGALDVAAGDHTHDTLADGVWSAYTPTITAVTANPTKDAGAVEVAASFRIHGNSPFGWVSYHLTQASPGLAGTGAYRWSLPFAVNTSFCPAGAVVGSCLVNGTVGVVRLVSPTTVELVASAVVSDSWLGFDLAGTWTFQASVPLS